MATEKVSVSLDPRLVEEARQRIRGRATLSAYVNDALRRKLFAERHTEYLSALDDEYGPISPKEQSAAADWWAEMKEKLEPRHD
jgi:hypothetical protein